MKLRHDFKVKKAKVKVTRPHEAQARKFAICLQILSHTRTCTGEKAKVKVTKLHIAEVRNMP